MGLNSSTDQNTGKTTTDHIFLLALTAYQTLVAHGVISALPVPRHAGRP